MLNHYEQRYEQWRDANPHIMSLYRRFALQAMAKSQRFSIALLTERVRWETVVNKKGVYKINNNFKPYIARDLAKEIPDFEKFVETRRVMGEVA